MRTAARVDANQTAVVKYLRQCGMSAEVLSAVGKGCPDLIVGFHGLNILLEIKDGAKSPSKQSLTVAEADWHAAWGGQVTIATSPEEAASIVVAACKARGVL